MNLSNSLQGFSGLFPKNKRPAGGQAFLNFVSDFVGSQNSLISSSVSVGSTSVFFISRLAFDMAKFSGSEKTRKDGSRVINRKLIHKCG